MGGGSGGGGGVGVCRLSVVVVVVVAGDWAKQGPPKGTRDTKPGATEPADADPAGERRELNWDRREIKQKSNRS